MFRAPGVALSLFPLRSQASEMERREAPGASGFNALSGDMKN
jgi:hypothetical protein